MIISIFHDITPLSPMKVNQHFRGACRVHLQVRRSQVRNHQAELWLLFASGWFLALLIFQP
jgi:hypothetical protein